MIKYYLKEQFMDFEPKEIFAWTVVVIALLYVIKLAVILFA